MNIKKFTFNPFQENTFLVWDDKGIGAIIDPGCYTADEEKMVSHFIEKEGIQLQRLLNTHAHLDHIFGNHFIHQKYDLLPEMHKMDEPLLEMADRSAQMYGIPGYKKSPAPKRWIEEGEIIEIGGMKFKTIFGPGHAPGHIAFYNEKEAVIFSGDILFQGSFGRTDLPGGDFNTLKNSIIKNMFTLPEETKVFSGHGPETSIGAEKKNNPILFMNA